MTHTPHRPAVLFVCVHNAGRSQMAAAYTHHLSGGAVEVRSAGSAPADHVNPSAVDAMAEDGIDITAETPKVLTADAVQSSDVVITMGCGDACPIFPGKRYEDWELEDPAGRGVDAVRPIRDDIRTLVEPMRSASHRRRHHGSHPAGFMPRTIALWMPSPTSFVKVIDTSTNPAARRLSVYSPTGRGAGKRTRLSP